MRFDTHIHTKRSPCSGMSPKKTVKTAEKRGLDVAVVLDHNEIEGGREARRFAEETRSKLKIELGCELTTEFGELVPSPIN